MFHGEKRFLCQMQNKSYVDGERKSVTASGFFLWSCSAAIKRRIDESGIYMRAIAVARRGNCRDVKKIIHLWAAIGEQRV